MASADTAVERDTSLARGAATISIATAVSRITGFARVIVMAAALGTTFLANTYQTANTAPNVIFELIAAGVLTSVFVPTFVEYLVKKEHAEGWRAANALTSVALLALMGLAIVIALAAPLIMSLLTIGVDDPELRAAEVDLGTTFLRLFAPQVIFYGVGMIMTGALHAYRKFAMPAIAPIFNNVVVIAAYLTYIVMRSDRPPTVGGITTGETLILALGTTLGVVAMTVCLVPQMSRLGWKWQWRPQLSHPAVKKAAHVGAWALGYAGGYQAGLIVVLILANRVVGGVAAYQWAYVFFFVPHALFAAPIFHVLFPAMSEDAARGETESLQTRLRDAMRMLFFILAPIAAGLFVAAEPIARLTLQYGLMAESDARLVARVIAAFAIGLPTYSAFLVLTRAYYAQNDPKTPALVNAASVAIASAVGAILFFALDRRWAVPGLAFGHSFGFLAGSALAVFLLLRKRIVIATREVLTSVGISAGAAILAGAIMAGIGALLPDDSKVGAFLAIMVMALAGGATYVGAMVLSGSTELQRIGTTLRKKKSE
jgi:putative peptidoglycan lipid II flippase